MASPKLKNVNEVALTELSEHFFCREECSEMTPEQWDANYQEYLRMMRFWLASSEVIA